MIMKTNVATRSLSLMALTMCFLFAAKTNAQNRIGISAQAGTSNIEVNGLGLLDILDPYIKSIPQYSVGLDYEKEFNSHFSLITGAKYASRGFRMQEDLNIEVMGIDLPVGAKVDTRLQYLEVPLAFKYKFTDSGVTPFVKAGASAGYAIDGKLQPKVHALIDWNLPSININLNNDLYNRFDIAGLVGAGVEIPTNDIGAITLEVNYRHSMNDMFQDKITDIRIKSHGFTAGIGYSMRF
jgi:hypothetical protein